MDVKESTQIRYTYKNAMSDEVDCVALRRADGSPMAWLPCWGVEFLSRVVLEAPERIPERIFLGRGLAYVLRSP